MIHHYTSIQNLALILKSRKIRFTRIDKVDDLSELTGIAKFFFTCVFISCWTEDIEESIPLWKMYTPNMKGVRLSLPKEMFQKKEVKAKFESNFGTTKTCIGPLSWEETFTDNYIVMNVFDNPNSFYKKVKYQNNYPEIYQSFFKKDEKGIEITNMFDVGVYKNEVWSFQKESRFCLYASPLLPLNHSLVNQSKERQMNLASYTLNNSIENIITYIDVDLDESVINNLRVTIGPLCTDADQIIVSSLLEKFTETGISKPSTLCGIIAR